MAVGIGSTGGSTVRGVNASAISYGGVMLWGSCGNGCHWAIKVCMDVEST